MAFKPSSRKKMKYKETEISLTTVMNLMIILIPLLVQQAFAIKLATKPIDLPTGGGGGGAAIQQKAKLNLVVSITKKGFFVASSFGTLPIIPVKADGTYDYDALAAKLKDVKNQLDKSTMGFEDKDNVIIAAEPDIVYDIVVQTMDSANWIIKKNPDTGVIERESLFPNSMLSPGVQG